MSDREGVDDLENGESQLTRERCVVAGDTRQTARYHVRVADGRYLVHPVTFNGLVEQPDIQPYTPLLHAHAHVNTLIHIYPHKHTHAHARVCVCVCVCV